MPHVISPSPIIKQIETRRMHPDHPAWVEYQRKRWLRHDWQRWMRPDADRWMRPGWDSHLHPQSNERKENSDAALSAEIAAERELLAGLRAELATISAEFKFRRFLCDLKYSPDQPRVPAGNPDGGQWTNGGDGEQEANGNAIASSEQLVTVADADSTSPTGQTLNDAGPDQINVWAQYAQNSGNNDIQDPRIARTTQTLHDTLAEVNTDVSSRGGPLSGPLYGIRVHLEFADALRSQNLPGIGSDGVEQSFDKDGLTRYGMDGSIRTDVVLRDDQGKTIAIYDVKTGNATMGPTRAEEIRTFTRVGPDVPIVILHALKGTSRR
jgi:hypothetical protein